MMRGSRHQSGAWTVFQVGRKLLPPGTLLRRYYMHRYIRSVTRVQRAIQEGPAALARHLSAPEWGHLDGNQDELSLDPDALRMMIVLEAIFEEARTKIAPLLPGRMDCIFTWSSLELAHRFRYQYVPEGIIYRCRVLEGSGVELDGGLLPPGINLADLSPDALSAEVNSTQARAEKYWKAEASPEFPELLILGQVEVVELIGNTFRIE
jgi:hypothetical protein